MLGTRLGWGTREGKIQVGWKGSEDPGAAQRVGLTDSAAAREGKGESGPGCLLFLSWELMRPVTGNTLESGLFEGEIESLTPLKRFQFSPLKESAELHTETSARAEQFQQTGPLTSFPPVPHLCSCDPT